MTLIFRFLSFFFLNPFCVFLWYFLVLLLLYSLFCSFMLQFFFCCCGCCVCLCVCAAVVLIVSFFFILFWLIWCVLIWFTLYWCLLFHWILAFWARFYCTYLNVTKLVCFLIFFFLFCFVCLFLNFNICTHETITSLFFFSGIGNLAQNLLLLNVLSCTIQLFFEIPMDCVYVNDIK